MSENNEANNSDAGIMLMYKLLSKYQLKLAEVYKFIFSSSELNKEDLVDQVKELICTA